MTSIRRFFAMAGIAVSLMTPAQLAYAGSEDALPPLPVLTAEWWQWALSIPTPQNPLLDTNGQECMIGQRGSIWFLAGFLGTGGAVTRICSVPEDNTLFFPVINQIWFSSPGFCGNGDKSLTVKDLRAITKGIIDQAQNLSVKVDGELLKKNQLRRVQSQPFEFAFPADNLCGDLPAGIYSPAVDDGYYVTLEPLKRGSHKIHIGAELPGNIQDLTYDLTVVPVLLK